MGSLGPRRRGNKVIHNSYRENKRREEKVRQTKGIFLKMVFGWYNPRKKKKAITLTHGTIVR
jgi:hypothetical protein